MKEDVAKMMEDEMVLLISNACLFKVWERDFSLTVCLLCDNLTNNYSMK